MVGAKVNGKLVPIDYVIQNGDRIEIVTSQNSKGPSRDWLALVKSTQAKNKINQWFKTELKEDNILKGKELITQYLSLIHILLITTGCISFKKAFESIDWNTIVILAASQGFAKGLDSSGAGALIAEKILEDVYKRQIQWPEKTVWS